VPHSYRKESWPRLDVSAPRVAVAFWALSRKYCNVIAGGGDCDGSMPMATGAWSIPLTVLLIRIEGTHSCCGSWGITPCTKPPRQSSLQIQVAHSKGIHNEDPFLTDYLVQNMNLHTDKMSQHDMDITAVLEQPIRRARRDFSLAILVVCASWKSLPLSR
jgi:hypothetical protein